MYKSNMAKNPEKLTALICRLDQYPPITLNPEEEGGVNQKYIPPDFNFIGLLEESIDRLVELKKDEEKMCDSLLSSLVQDNQENKSIITGIEQTVKEAQEINNNADEAIESLLEKMLLQVRFLGQREPVSAGRSSVREEVGSTDSRIEGPAIFDVLTRSDPKQYGPQVCF